MWTIWLSKTIKQSAKALQKIRQAGEYTYNSKKQKRKHANKQAIAQDKYHNMPKKAELKQAQKSATLIWQLRNKNKRYSHRTKTQLTRKTVSKKKREKQRKKYAKKHTMRARNTEANLGQRCQHFKMQK